MWNALLVTGLLVALPSFGDEAAQVSSVDMSTVLEIRTYTLKPGLRDRFQELFVQESLPLLNRWGVDVVSYGPSLEDPNSWFLMRAFPSLEERQRQEDAFYASDEWRTGPRAEVLAAIETFTTAVVRVDSTTLQGLRRIMTTTSPAADLDTLLRLNDDYIRAVQMSDANRFRELLAEDFLCTQSDGTLMDRTQFLDQVARPYTLRELEAHDVNVRLLGDVALVHAQTRFLNGDGTPGTGRYTDVWARRNGRWVAVAAHVTRK